MKNHPGDAIKKDLWGPCSKLGLLADIFIAGRRDASGSFFAFIRYAKVQDAGSIERGLNKVVCRGRTLVANLAKHPRSTPKVTDKNPNVSSFKPAPWKSMDSRSFSDVLMGKSVRQPSLHPMDITLSSIKEISEWTDKSTLLGEAKDFDTLCNFPSLFALEGYDVVDCKYNGGMQVVIKFKSDRAAEIFKANKSIWMKWFTRVDLFCWKLTRFERIAWIKITGVPMLAWDESNFSSITGMNGKVVVNDCDFWNSNDMSASKLCILTAS